MSAKATTRNPHARRKPDPTPEPPEKKPSARQQLEEARAYIATLEARVKHLTETVMASRTRVAALNQVLGMLDEGMSNALKE